jgi:hypothetical protein
MCLKCDKQYCICINNRLTEDIIKRYINQISDILLITGIHLSENDFNHIKNLQTKMVLWLNNVPIHDINDVIRRTLIVVLRNSAVFVCDN